MLKYDSPLMEFIRKTADLIILNFIFIVCSIPIITIGAAYTAKSSIAMKIIRNEEAGVFIPYFKAFKENFRQSTFIWLTQLIVIALLIGDFLWIKARGFENVSLSYKVVLGILSTIILFINMTVYPIVARFEITTKEALKGAMAFSLTHYIKLFLIVCLEVAMVIACIWYFRWLPLVYLFCSTSATYFMCRLLIKEFKKTEESFWQSANMAEEAEENKENQV